MYDIEKIYSHLNTFGFNRMECEVYITLLKDSPLTGYRIAQIINKAAANTYKALESLQQKGAVVIEEGTSNKQFSAVPIEEFMDQMEYQFKNNRSYLEKTLHNIGTISNDDRIYRLQSEEQVFQRAESMIEKADKLIVIDAFPTPLGRLKAKLEEAAQKGVQVLINAYAEIEVEGCDVILKVDADKSLKIWPGYWLNVVSDGSEFLLASLERKTGGVQHAVWSNSPYMALIFYSGFTHEILFSALTSKVKEKCSGNLLDEISKEIDYIDMAHVPGFKLFNEMFGKKR